MAKLMCLPIQKLKIPNAKRHAPANHDHVQLCESCRDWGHISIHSLDDPVPKDEKDRYTTGRRSVTLEGLAQGAQSQCRMCTSVMSVYDARAREMENVQALPPEDVGVSIDGPFYLDSGGHSLHSPEGRPRRYGDRSDPDHIVVTIFIRVTIKSLAHVAEMKSESFLRSRATRQQGRADRTEEIETSDTSLFTITPLFKLTYSNDDAKVLTRVEEWNVPFFDTTVLRGWLTRCDDQHTGECVGKTVEIENLPAGFRVIDTHEDKIVEPNSSFRYVALSYMWPVGPDNNLRLEKCNIDTLEAPGSLRQVQLPNIISDAIALCRNMGERYLWIDRLCIIQDDEISKPNQINAMDQIYRLASFTIIGALNTRDDIGLPGCAGRPRHASAWSSHYEPEVELQGLRCGITADKAINTTLWNRRGWTFQERLLSRRCLYITHDQVIYKCCEDEAMEMLTWAVHTTPLSLHRDDGGHNDDMYCLEDRSGSSGLSSDEATDALKEPEGGGIFKRTDNDEQFTIQDGVKLAHYCNWIKDYSSRQLSVASDAFSAFAGVANALRPAFNCQMRFGIPEKYIPICLCWDCPGHFSPRGDIPEVPSWSWVSSSRPVTYDCEGEVLGRDFLQIASIVYFYIKTPAKNLLKLQAEERWIQHEVSIQEMAGRDELPPLRGKGIPGEWRSNKDWRECPQNPWTTFARQTLDSEAIKVADLFPGSLVFNTTVACLKIGQLSAPKDKKKSKSDVSNAIILSSNDEHVGTIRMMDHGWIENNCSSVGVQKRFEFIVISGRLQEYFNRKMSAFLNRYSDIWELNVMMVERLPCASFVARRMGIGTVKMCKWKDCSPRWETVVLC
ncbi:heterokaryon incompatibility protein-domain-containing protein [Xylaria bambusicola]|uniref:heterokaryon incompatibility protein-domain-containing protein n=1 Tax=Xylaria bambusicola TaxID=326684 RepID=UPI0020079ACB|nr:heterokaryon incompatibility protein-domain-containing protein [Xylaria bambusicola]KAI0521565.1 heterokaryon incompatibility protein-domain-containing protein [Xylaria bambusicola]